MTRYIETLALTIHNYTKTTQTYCAIAFVLIGKISRFTFPPSAVLMKANSSKISMSMGVWLKKTFSLQNEKTSETKITFQKNGDLYQNKAVM